MPILLDLIFLIILIFYTIKGCKNGLIKSIVNLISFFLCFLIAILLSSYLSNLTYENLVNIPLQNYVSDNFNSVDTQMNINQFLNDLSDQGSKFISNLFGSAEQKLSNYFQPNEIYKVQDIISVFSSKIIYPVFSGIIRLIYFLIIFIILKVIFNLFSKIFKSLNYIPILGNLNVLLGGVFGLLNGLILIMIILFIFKLIFNMIGYNVDFIDKTYLIKYFYNFINLKWGG